MLRGQGHSSQSPFERAAAFSYHANNHAIAEPALLHAHSNFETEDVTPTNPFVAPAAHEYPSFLPYAWRDVNWGLIGGLLFSVFCWWAIFAFTYPTVTSALYRLI